MNKARQDYYSDLISNNGNDLKYLFKVSKYLLNIASTPVLPPHEDKQQLANELGTFFIRKIANIRLACEQALSIWVSREIYFRRDLFGSRARFGREPREDWAWAKRNPLGWKWQASINFRGECGNVLNRVLGARFSKLPVITGPVKLFCFPFQMGVSKLLKIIQ